MIELGRRDLYQQISGFDLAADIDVALGDVAARTRVNVGLRESFRGARPRNRHDGVAGPHRRRADAWDLAGLLHRRHPLRTQAVVAPETEAEGPGEEKQHGDAKEAACARLG